MANLPEKNITQVDEITSVPANSKLFVNANGEFRQATVNEVVKSSTVVTSAVENAINTAVEDGVNSHFKQTTGSPILLTDTADGTLIDFKGKGRSTQKQYSGKNLLKPTISTGNASGVTFTKNSDGSYTVNGTNTETTEIWQSLGDVILADEDYIISSGNYGKGAGVFINGSTQTTFDKQSIVSNSDKNKSLKWGIGVKKGVTLNNVIIYPQLEVGTVATDYEPYVGGVASPNPDYPQAIKSVADSGYFDGELLQGYYSSTGAFTSTGNYVCNKNKIPCVAGDEIKLKYKESASTLSIMFFDENGAVVTFENLSNVSEAIKTAPTNATGFTFAIGNTAIAPQTAKPITVTINGKYALIVKSVGKNLIPYPYRDTTHTDGNAVIWTDNGDGTITANGTDNSKQVQQFYLIMDGAMGLEPNTTYILNGCPGVGSLSTYNLRLIINRGLTGSTWIEYRDFGNGVTFTTPSDYKNCSIMIDVLKGTTVSNLLVKPMLRRAEVTDNTYEPYKESVTYIPLNEPLRSLGNVKDEVNLDEGNITRRFKEVIFDGSDELWLDNGQQASGLYRYNIGVADLKKQRMGAICTHFTPSNAYQFSEIKEVCFSTHPTSPELAFFTEYATLTEFKTWLQANPITVQYELAEPIVEEIEPVDIVTYDNVTYLTASDNADMEIEYPTTKVAGIASIGYSKGRKAEYEVELLKAQLLELQTAMVNSL